MAKNLNNKNADAITAEFSVVTDAETGQLIDSETGEIINTTDMERRLVFLEQQIGLSAMQIAQALKEVKDERLYLCRGYKSMKEYVEDCLPLSLSAVKRYLQIADSFSEKAMQKLAGTPIKLLLEISRNEELKEEANSEDAEANDVIKKARELEKRKYAKKLSEYEEIIDGKEVLLGDLRDTVKEKNAKIEELRGALEKMATQKGIDPGRLIFVQQKVDALALIEESISFNHRMLGDISNIPHELIDAEVAGRLSIAVASIETSLGIIKNTFFAQLVPVVTDNEFDLVPEE